MMVLRQLIEWSIVTAGNGNGGAVDSLSPYLAPMLFVLGIVILGVILSFSIRSRVARRNADQPTAREQIDAIKNRTGHASHFDDADAKMAEVLQTVQELAARLNNRAVRLEQLIDEADRRIEQMSQPLSYSASQRDHTPNDSAGETDAEAVRPSSSANNPTQVARTDREREPQPVEAPKPRRETAPLDPLSKSVYELSDAGKDPVTIASELDEQVGKVELILALRPAEEQ